MLIFHKEGNFIKVKNPTTNNIVLTLPSVSCTLATKKDLENISMAAGSIKQPTFVTPVNNVIGFAGEFVISPYEANDNFAGEQTHVSIEISTNNNFTDLIVSQKLELTTNLLTMLVDLSLTKVYVRVKYHSGVYCSLWSDTIAYTTPEFYILKPTLLGPIGNNTALIPFLSTTDFGYVGLSDTHDSTTYQIATDELFSKIVYNITTDVDLTGHLLLEDLDYNTTYYIRARHIGVKYGNSLWSDTIVVKTIKIKNTILDITSPIAGLRTHGVLAIDHKNINAIAYGWRSHPYYAKIDNDNRIIKEYQETKFNNAAMYDEIIDSDGNIIFIGHGVVIGGNGNNMLRILKITPEFVVLKELNFSGILANAVGIRKDSLGNYFVVGTSHSQNTGVILKLNSNLDVLIAKAINLSNSNASLFTFNTLEIDSNDNIIVFGYSTVSNMEGSTVIKYDNNLNKVTSKVLNYYGNTLTIGGGISSTAKDEYGNIYAVGRTLQWDNTNNVIGQIYKLDVNLNIIKIKDFAGYPYCKGLSCITYDKGNLFVTGGGSYMFKLDTDMNLIKALKFNRSNNLGDTIDNDIYRHTLDSDGNFYGGGYVATNGTQVVATVMILERDNTITAGTTGNGLYTITTPTTALRDVTMTLTNISLTESTLSTATTIVNTTFTEIVDTIVSMDI